MQVAVIGLGYWGPNLLRNLYEDRICQQLHCCDLEKSRTDYMKIRYPSIMVTNDYKDILANKAIEAVVIATPITNHFSLGAEFLNAGKHVFIEKPLTTSSSDAKKLIFLAETNNLVLMVGHTFLYSPPVIKIKELIGADELGDIHFISTTRVNLGLHQKDVSVIWDLAPHDFSTIFWWLDEEPIRVSAIGKDCVHRNIPDIAFINLVFASGCIANVQVSWLAPGKLRRSTIVGSKKMVVYDDTAVEKVKIYDNGINYKDPQNFSEFILSYRTGDIISPKLETFEPLSKQMCHFIECCENGLRPNTDGKNGLSVVRALEAAENSLKNGGIYMEV